MKEKQETITLPDGTKVSRFTAGTPRMKVFVRPSGWQLAWSRSAVKQYGIDKWNYVTLWPDEAERVLVIQLLMKRPLEGKSWKITKRPNENGTIDCVIAAREFWESKKALHRPGAYQFRYLEDKDAFWVQIR